MKKERKIRVLYDHLLGSIQNLNKNQEFKFYPNKLEDPEHNITIFDIEEAGDLIQEISDGLDTRFSLAEPLPIEEENDYSKESREILGLRGDFYYLVNFNPKPNKIIESGAEIVFAFNEEYGLCLEGYRDKDRCYQVSGQRKDIIERVEKDYVKTSILARDTGYQDDHDSFRAQVRGINTMFRKKFPQYANLDFIDGEQNVGYRFNKLIEVKKY